MILTKASYQVEDYTDLDEIEKAGRTCYKSEKGNQNDFVMKRIREGHESVIEHSLLCVRFIIDRGVSHELVRHRLMAYSQESTRFCDYKGGVEFIIPPWVKIREGEYKSDEWPMNCDQTTADINWFRSMQEAEGRYLTLRGLGWKPQEARSVLPNSLKTEIVASGNFRQWRHIFELRALGTTGKPHPQMLEVMVPLLVECVHRIPVVFDDILFRMSEKMSKEEK